MKINIKCSSGENYSVEFDPSITVAEFKELVAKQSGVEVARQRLIYRGRVMKDPVTIKEYDIADGYAVHLVKSGPSTAAPAPPQASSQQPQQPQQVPQMPQNQPFGMFGAQPAPNSMGADAQNPFGMMANMQNNPELMQQMMNSPMMASMLNNPEMLREMMMNNPMIRQITENNPEIGQILSDPEMLRRSMEIARNPNLMREMMRNSDRAMSNIENLPGGFDALRRLYSDVQQPLHEAAENMANQASGSSTTNAQSQNAPPQANNSGPLPNPWDPSGGNNSGSQSSQAQGNPFGMFGSMGQSGANFQQASQMMNNPMMQQMMQQMLSNPQFLDSLIASNPMLGQMVQQMPHLRNLLANPQFIQTVMQMQGMMQPQQGAPPQQQPNPFAFMMNNPMFMQPQPPASQPQPQPQAPSSQPQAPQQPQPQQQPNPFAFMNPMFSPFMFGATPPQQAVPPQQLYAAQNQQLKEMGFYDEQQNFAALAATGGNVSAAIEWIFAHPVMNPSPNPAQPK